MADADPSELGGREVKLRGLLLSITLWLIRKSHLSVLLDEFMVLPRIVEESVEVGSARVSQLEATCSWGPPEAPVTSIGPSQAAAGETPYHARLLRFADHLGLSSWHLAAIEVWLVSLPAVITLLVASAVAPALLRQTRQLP